jgi:acetyl-CoA carboxylase biotin carboxylase subunit
VRIVRAAKELGLKTVAVYSDADAQSLAVQMADEAVRIGPAHATRSYLSVDAILQAAADSGAGAVHPGYGFLSENADFAERVEAAGLVFVGPTPHAIRTMGDKAAARAAAMKAGVPTVPGSAGVVTDPDTAVEVAKDIGYPIMIKASAGGGGRGIRVAHDEAELRQQFATATAEAQAAFGNGEVYLERFIRQARHIEVQILGDGQRVVHCFERECSLQRRRQKVWEEAPSAAISEAMRAALCESALRLANAVAYRGAGTLEYLYDDDTREFFFIEMNTRIQVEHPVTEMITGVDLVKEMLRIALGQPLRLKQEDIRLTGAAIEVRINAENAAKNFMPSPGLVSQLVVPGGPGVRFDTMLFPGYTVPAYYDSLLGKLIVHDTDRAGALSRMRRALGELKVEGIHTTIPLHRALCDDADVAKAAFHTGFLETWLAAESAPARCRSTCEGACMTTATTLPAQARYSFGGDEHLFVEISEEMSLPAFFKGMAICNELRRRALPGVTEICPANAAYLVRFDPDAIAPDVARHAEGNRGGPRRSRPADADPHRRDARCSTTTRGRTKRSCAFANATRTRPAPTSNTPRASTAMPRSTPSSRRIRRRPGSSRWSASWPACPSCSRWSSANGRSRCPST